MTMRAITVAASGVKLIAKSFADIAGTSVTTAVDFDVATVSIPAGTIVAGNALRWRLWVTLSAPGGNTNHRAKLKLGSTTIHSSTINFPTIVVGGTGAWGLEFLVGFPTISTQRSTVRGEALSSTGAEVIAGTAILGLDTASEDFTGTKNIVLVGNASYAAGLPVVTVIGHTLELLS